MTTNADRGILCQTIDAMLDEPDSVRAAQWLHLAGKVPGGEAMSVQYGVMIEEFVELLRSSTIHSPSGGLLHNAMVECCVVLDQVAGGLKAGDALVYFFNREETLDGLSDVRMTAAGVAYLGGFDLAGFDQKMYDSLFDKFNEDGSVVIRPGGKIGKREGWVEPDATPFIGEMPETPEEKRPFSFDSTNPLKWVDEMERRAPGIDKAATFKLMAGAMDAAASAVASFKDAEIGTLAAEVEKLKGYILKSQGRVSINGTVVDPGPSPV